MSTETFQENAADGDYVGRYQGKMVRETMAFRATVEPILMRERTTVTPRETRTALRGMFQPGVTWWN